MEKQIKFLKQESQNTQSVSVQCVQFSESMLRKRNQNHIAM